ncbi:MAG: hypothetical protein ABSA11_05605 [Candidatus Bathyarchaeia archaeon]|jgi:hypothetical protein
MYIKRGPDPRDEERQELIFHTLKNHVSLGFNELHRALKIEIGSKETLSKELDALIKKHEVEKDIDSKKYKVSSLSLFNAEFELTSKINEEIKKESMNESNSKKLLESLIKWMGILSMYCALKQIETGREWTSISSRYATNENGLLAPLKRHIINQSLNPKDINELRSLFSDLSMSKDAIKKIKELERELGDSYPTEIGHLDLALQDLEGSWEAPGSA